MWQTPNSYTVYSKSYSDFFVFSIVELAYHLPFLYIAKHYIEGKKYLKIHFSGIYFASLFFFKLARGIMMTILNFHPFYPPKLLHIF